MDCVAVDSAAAMEMVASQHVPLLEVALSLEHKQFPSRAQVLWAQQGRNCESISPSVSYGFWEQRPLIGDQLQRVQCFCAKLESDQVARTAGILLGSGLKQMNTAASAVERAAALLTIFKAIEAVARTATLEQTEDDRRGQEAIVAQLTKFLNSSKALNKKVSRVHTAHGALCRREQRFLNDQIAAMADKLKLPTDWCPSVLEFAKFRNKRLGHAGSSVTAAEVDRWWGRGSVAYNLAHCLLHAYADRLPQ